MTKQPSPRADALRAQREAEFAKTKTPKAPKIKRKPSNRHGTPVQAPHSRDYESDTVPVAGDAS